MPTLRFIGRLLVSHRAITRVSLAALTFTLLWSASHQQPTEARPAVSLLAPASILPRPLGVGISTADGVTLAFATPVDAASVAAALRVTPPTPVRLRWNAERTAMTVSPQGGRWQLDQRYTLVIGSQARTSNGEPIAGARYAFTTQSAPTVVDFQLSLAGADLAAARADALARTGGRFDVESLDPSAVAGLAPRWTARDVSAGTSIVIGFNRAMARADVARRFAITPHVAGRLSWRANDLVFTPTERLTPGGRYTISVIGAHDTAGNLVRGKANFSFLVRRQAQLTKASPDRGASGVEPRSVVAWFSQPMDVAATTRVFRVVDTSTNTALAGRVSWNQRGTQLTFAPNQAFGPGRQYEVRLGAARDVDGNAVRGTWTFATKAPPPPPPAPPPAPPPPPQVSTRVAIPAPAPAATLQQYALNQVNAARAAYGFAPLVLDSSISAVAAAHAWDQARNGYFSHVSLDGRTREDRLRAGGVSFGWSGENQCYLVGSTHRGTLDWCHSAFMAEPYPGQWNHIGNILDPRFHRMGVGIAQVGAKVVITWDFTD